MTQTQHHWWDHEQRIDYPDAGPITARSATVWQLGQVRGTPGYRLALRITQVDGVDTIPELSLWPWSGHTPALILSRDEAAALADALHRAIDLVDCEIAAETAHLNPTSPA
ncbi:hypothetical protein [Gordonia jacobaea]|uniref:hypothetical protein n=1 Tax=Gordonia jacobaea TaxID=122202 RepID=UPI003D70B9FF